MIPHPAVPTHSVPTSMETQSVNVTQVSFPSQTQSPGVGGSVKETQIAEAVLSVATIAVLRSQTPAILHLAAPTPSVW